MSDSQGPAGGGGRALGEGGGNPAAESERELSRRRLLHQIGLLGLGSTGFSRALRAAVQSEQEVVIDAEVVAQATKLAGLEFSAEERRLMLQDLRELQESYRLLRKVPIGNEVPPALVFDPRPSGFAGPEPGESEALEVPSFRRPRSDEDLAFLGIGELASLLESRQITSTELTEIYLERLRRYDARLHCVITYTEERARRQARRADEEIAAGHYRGPLHGIPWGAKDLLAVRGYPTTWGAMPYRDQVIDRTASVVRKLDAAGAVLVAKLSLGALAWGDVWFGGQTRNPWRPEQGSSGSSAGSAAATAAGLVGFALGSETLGSIVSPCTRCGVTGLRPTFGRVSRSGAMSLAWSMDKIGPIGRSVEDCARVLAAIEGPDGEDRSVRAEPLVYRPSAWQELRIGYVEALFEAAPQNTREEEERSADRAALEVLRGLGVSPIPVELPDLPVSSIGFILNAEAATAFDELTRSGRDDELVRQIRRAWPNVLRMARTIPAVEYLQANRLRFLLMEAMEESLAEVDVYLAPSFGGNHLALTNLTGHPTVVVPNGRRGDGSWLSVSFGGRLFREGEVLSVARAFERATRDQRVRPRLLG